MPYSKTHYYMLALLVITVLAFWPSYFGRLSDAPLAHHLHGVTGTLWILLIAVQSYVIHARKIQLHRRVGKLVLVLAPVLIGSFALVTWVGSQKAIAGHPFAAAAHRPRGSRLPPGAAPERARASRCTRRSVHGDRRGRPDVRAP